MGKETGRNKKKQKKNMMDHIMNEESLKKKEKKRGHMHDGIIRETHRV